MSDTETTAEPADSEDPDYPDGGLPGASSDPRTTYRRLWRRTKGPVVAGWWLVVTLFVTTYLLAPTSGFGRIWLAAGYGSALLVVLTLVAPLRSLLAKPDELADVDALLRRMGSQVVRAVGALPLVTFGFLVAVIAGLVVMSGLYHWLGSFGGTHSLRIGLIAVQWLCGTLVLQIVYRLLSGAENLGWLTPAFLEFRLAALASALVWGFAGSLFWVGDLMRSGFAIFGSETAEMLTSFVRVTLVSVVGFPILVAVVAVGATIEHRTTGDGPPPEMNRSG